MENNGVSPDLAWFSEKWAALDKVFVKRRPGADPNYRVDFNFVDTFAPKARRCIDELRTGLPLRILGRFVHEHLLIGRGCEGNLMLMIDNVKTSGPAKFLYSPEDCLGFVEARKPRSADHAWNIATSFYTIRPDHVFGGVSYVEPGAAFFVAAIEAAGGRTVFCCEGHPQGFYVDFQAPEAVTQAVLSCDLLAEPEAVNLRVGPVVRIKLKQTPADWPSRDDMLRQLADQFLVKLGLRAEDVLRRLFDPV